MNYENLLSESMELLDTLKSLTKNTAKNEASLQKNLEKGDLKSALKDLNNLRVAVASLEEKLVQLDKTTNSFDSSSYMESGDFSTQLLELCEEKNINVVGEFPVFEMFPYKVRIDAETQEIFLDKKKVSTLRPAFLVDTIRNGQEKLNKASFNAVQFANELEAVYDIAVLQDKKKALEGTNIYIQLNTIYKKLVPMARFKKDYDANAFAFDLARLYREKDNVITKSGRKVDFTPSRKGAGIRILNAMGLEEFLGEICFR